MTQELLTAFRNSWKSLFVGEIWEWCEENVVLPENFGIPGPFRLGKSQYLKQPFESLRNSDIRQVNICGSVQTGKSLLAQMYIPYHIINDYKDMIVYFETDQKCKDAIETRVFPILRNLNEIKPMLPTERYAVTKHALHFPHQHVLFKSANLTNTSTYSVKTIICDEVWKWKKGILPRAIERTKFFDTSKKILCISSASEIRDDWHTEFSKGTLFEWGFACPHCEHDQVLNFNKKHTEKDIYNGLTWVKVVDKNNQTDINATAKSAHLVCEHCRGKIEDTPINRELLSSNGKYIKTVEGDPTIHSYRWNALVNPNISFATLCRDYLRAHNMAEHGFREDLKTFWQNTLALFWHNTSGVEVYTSAVGGYDTDAAWSDETHRFMTIDCQASLVNFYYVVRGWAKTTGESRLLARGWAHSFEELRQIQRKWGVLDICVGIDIGYRQSVVAKNVVKYGKRLGKGIDGWGCWLGLKGSAEHSFSSFKDGTRRIYNRLQRIDPHEGTKNAGKTQELFPFHLWSNPSVYDILDVLRKSNKWTVPSTDAEYDKMMSYAHIEVDTNTNKVKWVTSDEGHAWDCEAMNVVMAILYKLPILPSSNNNPEAVVNN